MKSWIKYVIILAIFGAIVGYIIGLIYSPACPVGMECMGNPQTYANFGMVVGAVIGGIIGLIVSKIRK